MNEHDSERLKALFLALEQRTRPKLRWFSPEPRGDGLECRFTADLEVITEVDGESPRTSRQLAFVVRVSQSFPPGAPEFRVAHGSDRPFHPFFDREGYWSHDHLALAPASLEGWVAAFVGSLCFAFDRSALDRGRVLNQGAAEWFLDASVRQAHLFPTEALDFLNGLGDDGGEPERRRPRLIIHEQRRKKFELGTVTSPYRPRERPVPPDLSFESGVRSRPSSASRHFVTFQPPATRKLFRHIGWNEETERNRVEQGGIMLGHVYRDSERGFTYGLVEDIVPGASARGSSTYLELSTDVWKTMLDYVDDRLDRQGEDLQVIGWYHTHPNHLDVFMSGTDRGTQKRFFSEDWHFAVVLNPHREFVKAFHGAEALECNCNLLHSQAEPVSPPIQVSPPSPASPPIEDARRPIEPATRGQGSWPLDTVRPPRTDEPTADPSRPDWIFRLPRTLMTRLALWLLVPLAALVIVWQFFFSSEGPRDEPAAPAASAVVETAAAPEDPVEDPPQDLTEDVTPIAESPVPAVDDVAAEEAAAAAEPQEPAGDSEEKPAQITGRLRLLKEQDLYGAPADDDPMARLIGDHSLEALEGEGKQGWIKVRITLEGWLFEDAVEPAAAEETAAPAATGEDDDASEDASR